MPGRDLARALAAWMAPASRSAWRDLPASVTATTGTAPDGRRVHIVHNWSWQPTSVPAPVNLADALTGTPSAGTVLNIGPWDVRVLVSRRSSRASCAEERQRRWARSSPGRPRYWPYPQLTTGAQAYNPTGGILYQLGSEPCLKGRGNCAVYPKSAQLPSGRLVASFEKSTVVAATGSADRQTLPVYKSDDHGTTWQPLSEVKAPAYLSSDPQYAKYTSNWTNPYLYTLPQDVGNLKQGTLLLASVVSGDDQYYREHKAADPNWTPSNDGDRDDLAIALYSSTDEGASWKVVNVIATGGWQGGSAGAIGQNIAAANTHQQVDPVWEPYLMVYQGQLVCYYSDGRHRLQRDHRRPDPRPRQHHRHRLARPDPRPQDLGRPQCAVERPVVDIAGLTQSVGGGRTQIGGGRPGMANVVRTADGKWLLTFEYWGGGANTRYVVADNPLQFHRRFPDRRSRRLAAGQPATGRSRRGAARS